MLESENGKTKKAEVLRMMSIMALEHFKEEQKKQQREAVLGVYEMMIGKATENAKRGFRSYRFNFEHNSDSNYDYYATREYIRSLENFKNDFPILKEMLIEEGFQVVTNIFDPMAVGRLYLEIRW